MPTYEYQCTVCGHRFEKFQSFSAEPIKECPVCGEPVKKLIAPAGIIFKGSGWYITDSKKSGAAAPASSTEKKPGGETTTDKASGGEKAEGTKTADSASSKSESTGANASESKPAAASKGKEDAA